MKVLKGLGAVVIVLILGYFLGPELKFDKVNGYVPKLSLSIEQVEEYLEGKQSLIKDLRPGNGYQLDFYNGIEKTEYVLIYLHGFSASPVEGAPLHINFAKRYGMNFYAPLLSDHGRETKESFLNLEPQDLMADAAEALAIGKLLGEKLIVMSCSTGGTLSTFLEAKNKDLIHAQILYSPNFDLADSGSKLLTRPWGLQLFKLITGSEYRSFTLPEKAMPYWTTEYRAQGVVALRSLIDQTMTKEIWSEITAPYMVVYYYENEDNHDEVISIEAIKSFSETTKTRPDQKLILPLASPKSHVINSNLQSKDFDEVQRATFEYAEKYLKLSPVQEVILSPLD